MKSGVLSAQEKVDAVAVLRGMMTEMTEVSSDSNQTAPASSSSEPAAKKRKVTIEVPAESNFFGDLFDSGTAETSAVDELVQYLNSNASSGLLRVCEGKEEVWPKLSQCAQWVL